MAILKSIDDQQLVKMYINGNDQCVEELLRRYKTKIFTSIYLMVKSHHLAEDIFQETFIKAINTLKSGKYNEEGKFLPWIIRIAHNLVIDHFRKAKRTPIHENSEDFDIFELIQIYDENIEDKILKNQSHIELKKIIQKLPDEQKEVLIMRYFADLSFKEIADLTEVSINTALGRMRYALNNLRKMMDNNLSHKKM